MDYSPIKRSKILTDVVNWMNLQTLPRKRSQTKKSRIFCMMQFIYLNSQIIEIESRLEVTRGWGWGRGNAEQLLNSYRVFLRGDEKVLKLERARGCTTL